jgi:transketolase
MSNTELLAKTIRIHALRMVAAAKASHIGSCLSCADILAVLYGEILRINPVCCNDPNRDIFIMSKGHAAAVLYAVLAESDFFPISWLDSYCCNGSVLAGHVSKHGVPGVELSTGSLGHGLSVGCGFAIAAKADNKPTRTFVLLSDGECDEGSNWEAVLCASHFKLDNLVAIIDFNKIQSFGSVEEVMNLEPFADKWKSFGWAVHEVDGHDHSILKSVFQFTTTDQGKPSVVIAHTTKGKGVKYMENELLWHYRNPNDDQLKQAIAELDKTE